MPPRGVRGFNVCFLGPYTIGSNKDVPGSCARAAVIGLIAVKTPRAATFIGRTYSQRLSMKHNTSTEVVRGVSVGRLDIGLLSPHLPYSCIDKGSPSRFTSHVRLITVDTSRATPLTRRAHR